jgi:hypothetical protein
VLVVPTRKLPPLVIRARSVAPTPFEKIMSLVAVHMIRAVSLAPVWKKK